MKKKILLGIGLLGCSLLSVYTVKTTHRKQKSLSGSSSSTFSGNQNKVTLLTYQPALRESLARIRQQRNLSYALADIDQDGEEELLLGYKYGDGSVQLIGLYDVQEQQVLPLLEMIPDSLQVFQEGYIVTYTFSATGGLARLYQLSSQGGQLLEEKAFQDGQSQPFELFDLKAEFPVEQLSWKSVSAGEEVEF
ncbi:MULTISPECIES: hypothetical protein [unclassified Streptococcus]|uniref:hypothetical protein n=1 Tax=unclassified Streptococcus TaxID=2608887 RepID=UPI001072938E|nr:MULTISPECIES: hypothetical protein [unclassified Streptococcus]MBF0806453.1 hypothetical protein [Streptococcus sp. 19428wA2_WM07]TFU27927.1 hypothetical protein E4T71_06630 [Streptococcus sp. WM07]